MSMQNIVSHKKGYMLAAGLGVLGGGMIVALATRAVPKILTRSLSGIMRNMMSQMGADGCDPEAM